MIVILAVAREGSFTLAAAKLGMTQSVLSHIILRLETRLGVCACWHAPQAASPPIAR
jgi:DNA-binding transcriptional LysR family regulator